MDLRDYDPAIGRWVNTDPIVHYNQSSYLGYNGNPVYFADPSGAEGHGTSDATWNNGLDFFAYDNLGRNKFDWRGMFVPMGQRVDVSMNSAFDGNSPYLTNMLSGVFGGAYGLGTPGYWTKVRVGTIGYPEYDEECQCMGVSVEPVYSLNYQSGTNANQPPSPLDAIALGLTLNDAYFQAHTYNRLGITASKLGELWKRDLFIHRGQVLNFAEATSPAARSSLNAAKLARGVSKSMMFVGIGIATVDLLNSEGRPSDWAKFSGAMLITAIGSSGQVGAFVSIGLGIADGLGAFDDFYMSFDK